MARGQNKVVIFSTPGCASCRAAKDYFTRRGFAIEEVDLAGSMAAKRRMARVAPGARVVPVIVMGDEVELGWRPDYWRKRLGG